MHEEVVEPLDLTRPLAVVKWMRCVLPVTAEEAEQLAGVERRVLLRSSRLRGVRGSTASGSPRPRRPRGGHRGLRLEEHVVPGAPHGDLAVDWYSRTRSAKTSRPARLFFSNGTNRGSRAASPRRRSGAAPGTRCPPPRTRRRGSSMAGSTPSSASPGSSSPRTGSGAAVAKVLRDPGGGTGDRASPRAPLDHPVPPHAAMRSASRIWRAP